MKHLFCINGFAICEPVLIARAGEIVKSIFAKYSCGFGIFQINGLGLVSVLEIFQALTCFLPLTQVHFCNSLVPVVCLMTGGRIWL